MTGLRCVAAGWVLLFHFHFTPGQGLAQVLAPVGPVVGGGALGVDLFFVLSGFVIAHTYLRTVGPALRIGPAARYLWARMSRLWPAYVVVTALFGVLLLGKQVQGADAVISFQTVQPQLSPGSALAQLLMVQMWTEPFHDGVSWVGPAWSISAEWLAYVAFPLSALLFFQAARLPRWVLGALAVGLMAPMAVVAAYGGTLYVPYGWLVRVLAGFSAGVLTYLVVRGVARTNMVRRRCTWVLGCSLLAMLVGLYAGAAWGPGDHGAVVLVLFPILIGAIALRDGGPSCVLSSRWAVHGGRISYSLYLVHIPLLELAWTAMGRFPVLAPDSPGGVLLALLTVVGAVVTAHLLWRYVEEPARLWLRAVPGRRWAGRRGAVGRGAVGRGAGRRGVARRRVARPPGYSGEIAGRLAS